jgi:hypothetical protein
MAEIPMLANQLAAYGMYSRNIALPEIVSTLNRAGFENEDICMVLSPAHPVASVVRDARIDSANLQDGADGANLIGWFSKFGAVVIPTVGFFIRSQGFLHALLIKDEGSALCGGSKTLSGLGFSNDDASRLGRQLGDVGALVTWLARSALAPIRRSSCSCALARKRQPVWVPRRPRWPLHSFLPKLSLACHFSSCTFPALAHQLQHFR